MPVTKKTPGHIFCSGRVGTPKAKLTTTFGLLLAYWMDIDPKGIDNQDLICFTPFIFWHRIPFLLKLGHPLEDLGGKSSRNLRDLPPKPKKCLPFWGPRDLKFSKSCPARGPIGYLVSTRAGSISQSLQGIFNLRDSFFHVRLCLQNSNPF